MKYRKKPVVIEARQITTNNWEEVTEWCGGSPITGGLGLCTIKTLEGDHIASPNDYIIKGVAGEFYPCKPDIFEQTYEVVE
jgi:hypothetical protein